MAKKKTFLVEAITDFGDETMTVIKSLNKHMVVSRIKKIKGIKSFELFKLNPKKKKIII